MLEEMQRFDDFIRQVMTPSYAVRVRERRPSLYFRHLRGRKSVRNLRQVDNYEVIAHCEDGPEADGLVAEDRAVKEGQPALEGPWVNKKPLF